jgi:polysaccharide biosynthesis protein PslH
VRILLVTPMPPRRDAPGAIPLVLQGALAGLQERNEVTLVTAAGDEPGEQDAVSELLRSSRDVYVVDRRQPEGFARWRRRGRLAAAWARGREPWRTIWFADPQLQHVIDRLVASRSFDVVAVQDNAMGGLRFPAAIPTVLTEHEVQAREQPASTVSWSELDRRRWRSYQPRVWRRFDRIEVFSTRDAARLTAAAPDLDQRVRVNPFGIVLPAAVDPSRQDVNLVVFAGNYTHPPNIDAALWVGNEIMPRLRAEAPGVRLALLGPGAPREVRALAGADVEVVGEVPSMLAWLEAAAVVVAPVRKGGGMRMKVLYALASGTAVVTTALGAEGLRINGREPPLELAESTEALAATIARLLHDEHLRRALGARARTFAAEEHSAAAYGARLEAVYNELLEERQTAPVGGAGRRL